MVEAGLEPPADSGKSLPVLIFDVNKTLGFYELEKGEITGSRMRVERGEIEKSPDYSTQRYLERLRGDAVRMALGDHIFVLDYESPDFRKRVGKIHEAILRRNPDYRGSVDETADNLFENDPVDRPYTLDDMKPLPRQAVVDICTNEVYKGLEEMGFTPERCFERILPVVDLRVKLPEDVSKVAGVKKVMLKADMMLTRNSLRQALVEREGDQLADYLRELGGKDPFLASLLSQDVDLGDPKAVRTELSRFETRISRVLAGMDEKKLPGEPANVLHAWALQAQMDADPRKRWDIRTYMAAKRTALKSAVSGQKNTPTLVVGDTNQHEGVLVQELAQSGYNIRFQVVGRANYGDTIGRRNPAKAAERGEVLGVGKGPDSKRGIDSYYAPLAHYPEIEAFVKANTAVQNRRQTANTVKR